MRAPGQLRWHILRELHHGPMTCSELGSILMEKVVVLRMTMAALKRYRYVREYGVCKGVMIYEITIDGRGMYADQELEKAS